MKIPAKKVIALLAMRCADSDVERGITNRNEAEAMFHPQAVGEEFLLAATGDFFEGFLGQGEISAVFDPINRLFVFGISDDTGENHYGAPRKVLWKGRG